MGTWFGRGVPPGDIARLEQLEADVATKASSFADLAGSIGDGQVPETAVTQHEGAIEHQNLSGAGSNTHAALDAHVADLANPHASTAAQVGADPVGTAAAAVAAHDVANRHIDHSAVHIATSATSGLKGGGDTTLTRNLQVDVNLLTSDTVLSMTLDRIAIYQSSSGLTKKVAPVRFINDAGSGVSDIWSGSKITAQLATKANVSHTHAAADVVSGTFADARISQSSVTLHADASMDAAAAAGGWHANATAATSGTAVTVPLDTENTNVGGHLSLAANEITVGTAGKYLVAATWGANLTTGFAATTGKGFLEVDTGGGYGALAASEVYTSHPSTAAGHSTASRTIVRHFVAGTKIRMRFNRQSAAGTITTLADACGLAMHYIRT